MKTIALAIMVAVIVEAIIEYGQTVYEMIEELEYKKAIKQGVAIIVAIIFAFELHVTLLTWLTSQFGITINPVFDMAVSGIFMSRGANYLSDFIRLILNAGTDHEFDDDEDEEDEDEEDETIEEES